MKTVLCALNAKFIHTSLALRYLKAYLCEHGIRDVHTQEYTINDLEERILDEIYLMRPEIISFSCYIWNIEPVLRLASSLKKLLPETLIVLGGPEASFDSEILMVEHSYIDAIVRGDGEEPFYQVVRSLQHARSLEGVPSVCWRENGAIVTNHISTAADLSAIPFPYESELDGIDNRIIYYESSRGCPFNCTYCLSSIDKRLRLRSLDLVKSELERLSRFPAREIKFVDRSFNADETRAREIMEHILKHPGSNHYHFEICADRLSDSMMDFLLQVPDRLFHFEIGVQSANEPVLKAVDRSCDLERLRFNIDRLVKQGNIRIHLDLLAGLPYDDRTSMTESFNWVYERQPDHLQLGFLKMLKGTRIRNESEKHGYIFKDYPPYEVLENRYMDRNAFIELKQIETVVERLYNTSMMPNTLKYLTGQIYEGQAYDFYAAIAAFWESRKGIWTALKRAEQYNIVLEFTRSIHPEHLEKLSEWIRYDYMRNNYAMNLPSSLQSLNHLPGNQSLLDELKGNAELMEAARELGFESIREARNHLLVQYMALDPLSGEKLPAPVPAVFCYEPRTKRCASVVFI